MIDCLFCEIIDGSVASSKVYEDKQLYVFKDTHPRSEVHILVVPKEHIKSINELTNEHQVLISYNCITIIGTCSFAGLS